MCTRAYKDTRVRNPYAALLSRQVERGKTESRLEVCHPRCSDVDNGGDDANINGNKKDAEPSNSLRIGIQSNHDERY